MSREHVASSLVMLALSVSLTACDNEVRDDTSHDAGLPEWADTDFTDLPDEISEVDRTLYGYAIGGLSTLVEHRGYCYCGQGLGGLNVCDALTEQSPCFAAFDDDCLRVAERALNDHDYAFLGRLAKVRRGASDCGGNGETADCEGLLECYDLAIPLVQAACAVAPSAVLEVLASCPAER